MIVLVLGPGVFGRLVLSFLMCLLFSACGHMVEMMVPFDKWYVEQLPTGEVLENCVDHPQRAVSLKTSCWDASARVDSHGKAVDRRFYPEVAILCLDDAACAKPAVDSFDDEVEMLEGVLDLVRWLSLFC